MEMIPGLVIYKDVIAEEDENNIIKAIDKKDWSSNISRRTQHYGFVYNYNTKTTNTKAEDFIPEIRIVSNWLESINVMNSNQCIINEYTKNQGIGKHIDSTSQFGPVVASLSLGGHTNFIFSRDDQKIEIEVPRRSLLILKDDARYFWTHEIPKRVTYTLEGQKINKSDDYSRISLTFRTMK
jgi:alkylated DNA repair dioxygenase AlkB